ncbi:MAG: type II secretion system protein [Planctomycetota bacterium]
MRRSGFTLLEILIAMSLFTLIGFSVVLLMTNAVDMWMVGTRGSQNEDRKEMSLPRLEDDLRSVRTPDNRDRIPVDLKASDTQPEQPAVIPDNRFMSGYVNYTFGERQVPCRYLAFVRHINGLGEIEVYASRAGTNPKADKFIDGQDDEKEWKENLHLPTGGAIEVLWIWLPDPDEPGIGAVYRAYRSPIGGEGTLLDPKNFDEYGKLIRNIQPQPVFQDVLLFDLYFWTQYTTTWEYLKGDPRVTARPQALEALGAGPSPCGPSRIWDSTRGLLVTGDGAFALNNTARSANYAPDDIWPRRVRVEFALKESSTQLKSDLPMGAAEFSVHDASFGTGMGILSRMLFKVGPEWVMVEQRDSSDRDTFLIGGRGRRNTVGVNHPAETNVYLGQIYDVTIPIPAFRDDNN